MERELTIQLNVRLTPDEYLLLEGAAETRSEYLGGEMIPMPPASRAHNLVVTNLAGIFANEFLDRPFETYTQGMRVKGVMPSRAYMYPDVVVVGGEPQFEDSHIDTLLNPTLVVEVLSKSTEGYDRGLKFSHYRSIESLQEYLLVSQKECRVEQYARQAGGKWLYTECLDPKANIDLASVACRLPLTRLYHRVECQHSS